jgi:hypothetical protein
MTVARAAIGGGNPERALWSHDHSLGRRGQAEPVAKDAPVCLGDIIRVRNGTLNLELVTPCPRKALPTQ